MSLKVDMQLECLGLSCPMPVVRTKQAMDQLKPGQVLEVQATDTGSLADIPSWAKSTGHQYLGLKQDGKVFRHYLRKASQSELKEEKTYPHSIQNGELLTLLEEKDDFTLIDVREPAEFAFGHISNARSIPLGELEERIDEIPKNQSVYLICRTGVRSDLAAQQLTKNGFKHVYNVVPGMSKWEGELEQA